MLSLLIAPSDFERFQPIALQDNNIEIRLFTTDDEVTLEYDDTVILRFNPDIPAFIPVVESRGEFIRDIAVVNIIDNDSKLVTKTIVSS